MSLPQSRKPVVIIAAVAENGVIGAGGTIPWHISEDFRRFKRLTSGHTVIMGRLTWDSLPRKPLPGRTNIIVSRSGAVDIPEGVALLPNLPAALQHAAEHGSGDRIYLIGGASIYREGLEQADLLELTRVAQKPEGDTFFPDFDRTRWQLTLSEPHDGFTFETWQRISPKS